MKIPALSGLAVDVKRIADALTKLAAHAEDLVELQKRELWRKERK